MKKTKVTDIVYKPFAPKIIKLMEEQLKNPTKRWDAPFNKFKLPSYECKNSKIYIKV